MRTEKNQPARMRGRLEVVGRGGSERGPDNPERPDRYANPGNRPCMVDAI